MHSALVVQDGEQGQVWKASSTKKIHGDDFHGRVLRRTRVAARKVGIVALGFGNPWTLCIEYGLVETGWTSGRMSALPLSFFGGES